VNSMAIEERSGAVHADLSPEPGQTHSVLYAGASADDLARLRKILPVTLWRVQHAPSAAAAIRELRRTPYDVVLCEKQLEDAMWAEMLELVSRIPAGPAFIVASLFADEHLWAEALNLGAYDVLAKPFEPAEVTRVLMSASRFRERRRPTRAMSADYAAAMDAKGLY
jgi:DNA-binding NtrC family response regulator